MCHKKQDHVLFFQPYEDTHGIQRVLTCTVWEKSTNQLARGVSVLSLDDEFNREVGRQLAYNKTARALAGRNVQPVITEKAWEAIQALKATELRDFFANYASWQENDLSMPGGYVDSNLTLSELAFFTRKGYCISSYQFDQAMWVEEQKIDDTYYGERNLCCGS